MQRLNLRIFALVAGTFCLVGFSVYSFAKAELSHGVEKDGNHFRVNLQKLGCFRFDPAEDGIEKIPPQFRLLDGKKVILEGYAYVPNSAGDQAAKYEFVYNIAKCCLGGPPLMQERVFATVRNPEAAPILNGEFRIFGKLHINTARNELGIIEQLYQIDVERSEPL